MNIDMVREFCLLLRGTKEMIQWESSLLFKVGGKIYVLCNLYEGSENIMSLKCSAEKFREMVEVEGIIPAPYLARNNWICLQTGNKLKAFEIKKLIKDSYYLVVSGLSKKKRRELGL